MPELANSSPSVSSLGNHQVPPPKRKRNQPGMPDPEAEVIALSPKTLMATNRFVCEICGKGFQRDQNLQLHRRGHNLPWKLKQRGTNEVRKRAYVCPEVGCVHNDPKRALGDLTGIKKHFCRKHGEKKWKCERCSKKYAVQSDWKAHMKICGTKEYKCDCGTVFSRRDSFVTHRAFCDALAQESGRVQVNGSCNGSVSEGSATVVEAATVAAAGSPVLSIQSSEPVPAENSNSVLAAVATPATTTNDTSATTTDSNVVFGSIFAPLSGLQQHQNQNTPSHYSNLIASMSGSESQLGFTLACPLEPPSLSLSSIYHFSQSPPSLYPHHLQQQFAQPTTALSATALLQKATQMGHTAPGTSLLSGFGLSSSSACDGGTVTDENGFGPGSGSGSGLGLGIGPTTLDLLGMGIGPFSDGLGLGYGGGKPWEGPTERKPN